MYSSIDSIRSSLNTSMCFLASLNIKYYMIVLQDINYITKVLDDSTSTFFYVYNKNDCGMYELIYISTHEHKFLIDNVFYINNSYNDLILKMLNFDWLSKNLYIKFGEQELIADILDMISGGFVCFLPKNTFKCELFTLNFIKLNLDISNKYITYLNNNNISINSLDEHLKIIYT